MMNRAEALEKISAVYDLHGDESIACPYCGEISNGLKIGDDLNIYALITKCCSDPVNDFPMFPFHEAPDQQTDFMPFNIQAALNGHPVIQRNGKGAVVQGQLNGMLLVDMEVPDFDDEKGCEVDIFVPMEVDGHGRYLPSHKDHPRDLFLKRPVAA